VVVVGPLERFDVLGGGTFASLPDVELNLLTFFQRLESVRCNRGVVDKKIRSSIVGRDESKALLVVEPLDLSRSHTQTPAGGRRSAPIPLLIARCHCPCLTRWRPVTRDTA
jgi:hypothetical protein